MARVTEEDWEGRTVEPVLATVKLADARQVETLLEEAGIDYMVELQPMGRGSLLSLSPVNGVVFYLLEADAEPARVRLRDAGFAKQVVEPDP